MAKFDKIAVLNKIGSTGMVPVFYHKDAEVAKKVVKACYDGGVRAFEFTNRGDFAQEVFAEIVKFAAKECPEMAIGIGSIVDPATAAMYLQLLLLMKHFALLHNLLMDFLIHNHL
jgi:2-dehydro-3-deoxyphosphogluconate aldolase/(4S)-4-hydroxy-2-oxoglutarate aldolase